MKINRVLVLGVFLLIPFLSMQGNAQIETASTDPILMDQSEELFVLLRSNYIKEFSTLVNQLQLKQNISYAISSTIVADGCTTLMNKDHFVGPTGSSISKMLIEQGRYFPLLLEGGSVNRYCRNYAVMSPQQKSLVWVLLLTVIAHFESSCNPKAHAKGPNGIAYGFYQQHAGQEGNYDGSINICRNGVSRDPVAASQCTLSMLENQYIRQNGELFSNSSYWDVLRPNGQSKKSLIIRKALANFSLCQPKIL